MEETLPMGIALGSNVGDRLGNLEEARRRLREIDGLCEPMSCSRIYATPPVGCPPGSPDFLNALVEVRLHLPDLRELGKSLRNVLAGLQRIEADLHRPPETERALNAPRTIDLDIIYAGDLIHESRSPSLIIPHPRAHQRAFVLAPLADLHPGMILPGQTEPVRELLEKAADTAQVRLAPEQWGSQS